MLLRKVLVIQSEQQNTTVVQNRMEERYEVEIVGLEPHYLIPPLEIASWKHICFTSNKPVILVLAIFTRRSIWWRDVLYFQQSECTSTIT